MLFNFLIPAIPLPFAVYVALLPSSSYVVNTLFLLVYSRLFNAEFNDRRLPPITILLVLTDFLSLLILVFASRIPYTLYKTFSVPADLTSYFLLGFICAVEGLVLASLSSLAFLSVDKKTLSVSWILANTISSFVYIALGGVLP